MWTKVLDEVYKMIQLWKSVVNKCLCVLFQRKHRENTKCAWNYSRNKELGSSIIKRKFKAPVNTVPYTKWSAMEQGLSKPWKSRGWCSRRLLWLIVFGRRVFSNEWKELQLIDLFFLSFPFFRIIVWYITPWWESKSFVWWMTK